MLNHKDARRVKEWLLDLTTKELLNRAYSRRFGENTKPAVYFLASKSRFFLREREDVNISLLNRIYKEKKRSQAFRERSMLLADIYLNLEASAKENKSTLHFYTKTELETYNYVPDPIPDAYIVTKQKEAATRYFLEIISDQLPRFVLRNRIEYLFEYYDLQTWQETTKHPFPSILMVCPNYVVKGFLSKLIGETLEMEGSDISFYLTTKDQLEAVGVKPGIWQKVSEE